MKTALRYLFLSVVLAAAIGTTTPLRASSVAYEDHATEVIYNSLKRYTHNRFLHRFYKRLLFLPAWMHEKGPSKAAKALFETIRQDATLDPSGVIATDATTLEREAYALYKTKTPFLKKMETEFRISLLYEAYTDYLYFGGINWGAFQARIVNLKVNDVSTEWELHRPRVDRIGMVERALLGGDLHKMLLDAQPKAYRYRALQKALVRYVRIAEAGGWPQTILHGTLKPSQSDEGVKALRKRLHITGEDAGCANVLDDTRYEGCIVDAVKRFQRRHGLDADGVVGPATLRALNVPVSKRIETIRLNLDRIKWLNPRQPRYHIVVNIPFFTLYFEENGHPILTMRVITGRPKNPTPIFSDEVEYVVLNPYWNVPKSIVQKEMIPKLLRNPYALKRQGIEIFAGWGKHAKRIDPATVDWSAYRHSKRLPFRFAQPPGDKNALGRIKFLFPNRFAVYMHDTPAKSLFRRTKRAFSHGCVRLQKPMGMLETLAKVDPSIDVEKAKKILQSEKNVRIKLKRKIPIDIVYLTAWVDYDGVLQFRDDVYGYDAMQLKSYKRW